MGFFLDQKIAGFASSYKNQVRLDPVVAGGACDLLILIVPRSAWGCSPGRSAFQKSATQSVTGGVTTLSVGTINVGACFGEVYIGAG
jgi:hypothetical protein